MEISSAHDRFYYHVCVGGAGEARPLMARLALHMAGERPWAGMQVRELLALGKLPRPVATSNENELLTADFLRECMISGPPDWNEEQVARFLSLAGDVGERVNLSLVPAART